MIGIFLILIFFLIFYISRNREKFVSLPATLPSTITKTALYTIPLTNRPSHITLFGGGGGGAATNLATGNIYPGGGGGQGYAALGSIPINARYLNVVIGKGGTSDINGGTTIVQTLDENKNVIQTLFALGGYAGSQGYISTWDVPTPGDGGNGFCGGGGGGAGNFPVHQRTKQSTGGSGVLPQYNGADGSLYEGPQNLPVGGQGGCGGGNGGPAWFNLGGGGGGGGKGGGNGGADGTEGNSGEDAIGLSAGGGGAAFGANIVATILAGGKGGDGYVLLT